jgi:hypothetical protein
VRFVRAGVEFIDENGAVQVFVFESPQAILVTGGAGFIGGHTVLALVDRGEIPIVSATSEIQS